MTSPPGIRQRSTGTSAPSSRAVPAHAIVADVPCFYLPHNERKVTEANRLLRAAARDHGLRAVPLHEHTRRQGLRGILTEFARDMFHPNDAGYRVWAGAFRPAVAARLAETQPAGRRRETGAEVVAAA